MTVSQRLRCPKCGRPERDAGLENKLGLAVYVALPAAILYFFLAGCGLTISSWGPGPSPPSSLWPQEHLAAAAIGIAAGLSGVLVRYFAWQASEKM